MIAWLWVWLVGKVGRWLGGKLGLDEDIDFDGLNDTIEFEARRMGFV